MKLYDNIGSIRLLNIRVYLDGTNVIYEVMVEDAPDVVKERRYSKIMIDDDGITNLYVYSKLDWKEVINGRRKC